MLRYRFGAVVLAIGLALTGGACSGGEPTAQPTTQVPRLPQITPANPGQPDSGTPLPQNQGPGAGNPNAPNDVNKCQGNTLEGCFNKAGMLPFYNVIIDNGREFLRETYRGMTEPTKWWYLETGETMRPDRCGVQTSEALAYCYTDQAAYVGQDSLWTIYSTMGDAAAFVPVIHELGHHVQGVAQVPFNTGRAGIPNENQADCFAGAFFLWAKGKGRMEITDIRDIGATLTAAGQAESIDRDHGTIQERIASFNKGYLGGVKACNDFFPQTPLIS